MNLHHEISDGLLPEALRRPLRFGDLTQLAAARDFSAMLADSLVDGNPDWPVRLVPVLDCDVRREIFVRAETYQKAMDRVERETEFWPYDRTDGTGGYL